MGFFNKRNREEESEEDEEEDSEDEDDSEEEEEPEIDCTFQYNWDGSCWDCGLSDETYCNKLSCPFWKTK